MYTHRLYADDALAVARVPDLFIYLSIYLYIFMYIYNLCMYTHRLYADDALAVARGPDLSIYLSTYLYLYIYIYIIYVCIRSMYVYAPSLRRRRTRRCSCPRSIYLSIYIFIFIYLFIHNLCMYTHRLYADDALAVARVPDVSQVVDAEAPLVDEQRRRLRVGRLDPVGQQVALVRLVPVKR